MARRKSLRDIVRQTASLSARIDIARQGNADAGGRYGDTRDNTLRSRERRMFDAYSRYLSNIHRKQGTNDGYSESDTRPMATQAQMERKYSQRTYMGLANG